jgi:uncharacterized caspase-like protein
MRRFLLLLVLLWEGLFVVTRAEAAERVALIFGNGDYQNAPRLPNPVNDATDVAAAFERLGFSVQLIKDGTFDAMRRSLLNFAQQTSTADIAVVFFAGHGMEIRDENWLIPVDAELRIDVSASQEAVALASIMPIVSRARKLGLVVLDACRDNPFSRRLQVSQPGRALPNRGLGSVEPPGSVLVVFAAKHGTTADDGAGRNSPFTAALLHNLETPGLEINYLFRNVHDEVYSATQQRQEPYVYGTLSKESIYLRPSANGTDALATEAARTWDQVKDTSSSEVLNTFIERYAGTIQGALARERLAALTRDSNTPATAAVVPSPPAAPMQPAALSKAANREEPTTPKGSSDDGRDIARYDGTWNFNMTGRSQNCPPGHRTVSIHNGIVSARGARMRIAVNGDLTGHWNLAGLVDEEFSGRMSSDTRGNGAWRNNLGCGGGWTMSR